MYHKITYICFLYHILTMMESNVIEIWKDITGYESLYQVSNTGKVKSLERVSIFNNSTGLKKERFLKDSSSSERYSKVKLSKNSIETPFLVHRLVAKAFLENPNNKKEVNHINGIKNDNRVENLEWATRSENTIHAFETKLKISQKGSEHGNAKLNEFQVLEIREIGRSKQLKEIADIYNVDKSLISLVLLRKAWKHI